jgi:transcriptional regulator GlxA family with amidase domain
VERVRFDRARMLLDDGFTATQAAIRGVSSYEALRRVFVKRLAVAPRQYRQRFSSTFTDSADI